MDKKNWIMAAVTVSALVLAFTVVPALADDPGEATPQLGNGDWAEMVELCQTEGGHADMELYHQDHDHDGDHMDECLAGDGGGMMGGDMMGGGMMGGGMMGGGMMGGGTTGGGMMGGGTMGGGTMGW